MKKGFIFLSIILIILIASSCTVAKPAASSTVLRTTEPMSSGDSEPSVEPTTPNSNPIQTAASENTDEKKIENTIREYLSIKEDIVSRVGKHDFSEEHANVKKIQELMHGDAQKNKIAVVLQMQWNHQSSQSVDLSYADYRIEFEFGPVGIYKNVATDKVNVTTYINFAFNPSEESKVGSLHTVDLEKVGDTWLITNDDYLYNEYSAVYDRYEQEYLNDNVGGDYSAMNDYILSRYQKDIDQSLEGK